MSTEKQEPKAQITYDEAKFIIMAVSGTVEDLETNLNDPKLPWTPESRRDMKQMIAAGKSAMRKLSLITGIKEGLPPYVEGEEKDYFTKPS